MFNTFIFKIIGMLFLFYNSYILPRLSTYRFISEIYVSLSISMKQLLVFMFGDYFLLSVPISLLDIYLFKCFPLFFIQCNSNPVCRYLPYIMHPWGRWSSFHSFYQLGVSILVFFSLSPFVLTTCPAHHCNFLYCVLHSWFAP